MRNLSIIILCLVMGIIFGCAGEKKFHSEPMPDPSPYNAHFGDMDYSGDDGVKWYEFKRYFPDATPEIFMGIDLNGDGVIDHDEWHQFKEAHGLKHHD